MAGKLGLAVGRRPPLLSMDLLKSPCNTMADFPRMSDSTDQDKAAVAVLFGCFRTGV
jgi:hypothetical protein